MLAPPHWCLVDCISDLHLQRQDEKTFAAFRRYLETTPADAVFILGDWFEVWVGDDILQIGDPFIAECVAVVRQAAQRLDIFVQHGNRDFLMGQALMQACHATLLPDPCVLEFANQRWVFSHGDAWCIADTEYQRFRHQVRNPQWQNAVLQRPLAERLQLAKQIRQQSSKNSVYADVDTALAQQTLRQFHAHYLIHGHTHRPARHTLEAGRERWVLSDWDMNATPPRADVLRLGGSQRIIQRIIQRINLPCF